VEDADNTNLNFALGIIVLYFLYLRRHMCFFNGHTIATQMYVGCQIIIHAHVYNYVTDA